MRRRRGPRKVPHAVGLSKTRPQFDNTTIRAGSARPPRRQGLLAQRGRHRPQVVSAGWALAHRRYSTDYVDAENETRKAKRGMWKGTLVKPWEWRASSSPRRPQSSMPSAPAEPRRQPTGARLQLIEMGRAGRRDLREPGRQLSRTTSRSGSKPARGCQRAMLPSPWHPETASRAPGASTGLHGHRATCAAECHFYLPEGQSMKPNLRYWSSRRPPGARP